MKHRALLFSWLIYCTTVSALPASAADAGQAEQGRPPSRVSLEAAPAGDRSVLEGVAALDKRVTYTETKIPLGELVQKVAAETGVPLVAARDVADEPVAVVVKEFPARELLQQLANLLDYQWGRRGQSGAWRYEIWQDLASKRREEALRQAVFADVEQRFRQELGRYLEMATLSQEQIERLVAAEEQRRQELDKLTPEQRAALDSRPEARERNQRFSIAQTLLSPVPRVLVSLLSRLAPQQWAILHEEGSITFSTEPQSPASGNPALHLPDEVGRIFRASQLRIYLPRARGVASDSESEAQMRRREKGLQERWAAATGYRVTIRLTADQLPMGGPFSLSAEATPLRNGAPSQFSVAGRGPGTSLFLSVDPVDFQQRAVADTPQRRAELEKNPVMGVKKSFKPEATPRADRSEPWTNSGWRVQELMPALARTYGIQFISDAYWGVPSYSEQEVATREPAALYTLLDRLAGYTHFWDRQGNLVRLRSRAWFFDRPGEVPLRLLRHWKELCDEHGALPLEAYLEMVTSLTDGQLQTLGTLVNAGLLPRELHDLSTVHSARYALRLYGSLSPVQRQALWQGRAISVSQMTPTQRQLFAAAFREPRRARLTPLDLAHLAAGSLSLAAERYVRIEEQHGGATRNRPEPPIAAAVPLGAKDTSTFPRVDGLRNADESVSRLTPATKPAAVTLHPLTQFRFQFRYGPATRETVYLTVASPLGPG
jgi:hypothetical protein